MKSDVDPRRDAARELAAAEALKEQLRSILGEGEVDTVTLSDTIEGETDFYGAVDAVIEQIAHDTARVEGIAKFETTLAGRKHRLETRIDSLRAMLVNALDIIEQKKLERPLATVTLKNVPPKLKIVDEAQIPAQFFETPEPRLNRKALGDALKVKDHEPIPGAELDNGSVTIQLRFG